MRSDKMGLTNQQKLYQLPNYVLLLKDHEVVGLISCDDLCFSEIFESNGYTLKQVNFDYLYTEGIKIQQQLGLREKRTWMTAQEYMQKLNKIKNRR